MMRRSLNIAAVMASSMISLLAQEHRGASTLAELQQQLTEHVSQPRFAAAMWGVKVVSLESGKILFEQNAQKLFSPASNSKLYTVALALDRLGGDYRIKTSLYSAARPSRWGTLTGDLIVYGRGDPTINARLHNGSIYDALESLVFALKKAGVKRITGDLAADETYFHGPPYGSGWSWDDMEYYYGAEISALTINDNTLQVAVKPGLRAGESCQLFLAPVTSWIILSNRTQTAAAKTKRSVSFHRPLEQNVVYVSGQMALDDAGYTEDVTVHNPAGLFGRFLKEALAKQGIKVAGQVRTVNALERGTNPIHFDKLLEIGTMESLPLRDIAREIMKPSQNLYTDLLLEHAGETKRGPETPERQTSEDLGIAELNGFLREAGIKEGEVLFEEGSGLSRNNLTTPNATIALLEYMSKHKAADVYMSSLPIAGVDGTLRNRMKGTAAAGNARAKTGTLRWANSLSGYLTSAAGERLAFSIMLNRYHNPDPGRSARTDVDAVAVMLAEFSGRSQ
jgi:D-alanyl-D-alanine carboxypeptidase/D-alanyl-D-alanine-endopeptidase (penicillin-binding protein 4)